VSKRKRKKRISPASVNPPPKHLDTGTVWTIVGVGLGVLTGILGIAGVIRVLVAVPLLVAALVVTVWALGKSEYTSKLPQRTRGVLLATAGIAYCLASWPAVVTLYHRDFPEPSFVFFQPTVVAVDNPKRWLFGLRHRGPESLSHVEVIWTDKAEPFTPDRRKVWTYLDIDPEPRTRAPFLKQFPWITPDVNHEHYTVDFTFKGGTQDQDLRIELVSDKWVTATRVRGNDRQVLLECRDPEFPNGLGYDGVTTSCWPDFPKGYQPK